MANNPEKNIAAEALVRLFDAEMSVLEIDYAQVHARVLLLQSQARSLAVLCRGTSVGNVPTLENMQIRLDAIISRKAGE